jgi:GT2 family glycosyltransferase
MYRDPSIINSIGNITHYLGFGYSLGEDDAWDEVKSIYSNPREICYGSGVSTLLRSSVIKDVGLYDADFFMYHEDLDFGWRARLAGYTNYFAPDSVVYHNYEFAKSIKQYYWMERNRFVCLFKNYKVCTLVLLFPALLFMECGLFFFSVVGGFWKEKLKVYAYILKPSSWKRIVVGRKVTKRIRTVKDREMLRLFTGSMDAKKIDNVILRRIANPIFVLYFRIIKSIIWW